LYISKAPVQKHRRRMRGSSGLKVLLILEGKFNGIKQQVDPQGHGQMTLTGGCRRKSMMKLRD